jgi:hypothetical protein
MLCRPTVLIFENVCQLFDVRVTNLCSLGLRQEQAAYKMSAYVRFLTGWPIQRSYGLQSKQKCSHIVSLCSKINA